MIEIARGRQYLFLFILLAQISVLSLFIFSVTWHLSDSSTHLIVPFFFSQHVNFEGGGVFWEIIIFVITSILMRISMELYPRILLISALFAYTLSGSFIATHLASLLVVCTHDTCVISDYGKNTIYVSTPLLVIAFLFIHTLNIYQDIKTQKEAVISAIARNTMIVLFIVCTSICIIDDSAWDWDYAYAFLFTLALTTYLNGFSTFILFSKEVHDKDVWQMAALVYLQPLLFIEDSVKVCLTT